MIQGKVEVLGQNPIAVLFCLPQSPHGLTLYPFIRPECVLWQVNDELPELWYSPYNGVQ